MTSHPTQEQVREAVETLKLVALAHDSLPMLTGREQRALRTLLASYKP